MIRSSRSVASSPEPGRSLARRSRSARPEAESLEGRKLLSAAAYSGAVGRAAATAEVQTSQGTDPAPTSARRAWNYLTGW
jgi:hypothetical protein